MCFRNRRPLCPALRLSARAVSVLFFVKKRKDVFGDDAEAVPLILAVFDLPECSFKNHGPQKSNEYSFVWDITADFWLRRRSRDSHVDQDLTIHHQSMHAGRLLPSSTSAEQVDSVIMKGRASPFLPPHASPLPLKNSAACTSGFQSYSNAVRVARNRSCPTRRRIPFPLSRKLNCPASKASMSPSIVDMDVLRIAQQKWDRFHSLTSTG